MLGPSLTADRLGGMKRERSQSLESTFTEQEVGPLDASAVEAAEMLAEMFCLSRHAKVRRASPSTSPMPRSPSESLPAEPSASSEGSACSAPAKAHTATSTSNKSVAAPLTSATRSYVWRGPSRRVANHAGSSAGGTQVRDSSSDPDDEDECPGPGASTAAAPSAPAMPTAAVVPSGSGDRSDRDKEWAALTTWLRMNLHHPRTAKREVLFVGKHVEGRGWNFFLNPALTWADVSPETKMRLRTLPQETELAFMHKYPNKPGRDWVKKAQKYRPPGCSVTYSVPLADMIYSLTAIYYQFEGRPGTGASTAARAAAAAAAQPCGSEDGARAPTTA